MRDELDDSRLDDISDLKLDGDDKEVNKSVPLLENSQSQELLSQVATAQGALKASHDLLPKAEKDEVRASHDALPAKAVKAVASHDLLPKEQQDEKDEVVSSPEVIPSKSTIIRKEEIK